MSLLARCFTASTPVNDPLLSLPSVDLLDGDVMRTSTPSLEYELRIGDDPERFLTGIFANLICCAALEDYQLEMRHNSEEIVSLTA